MRQFILPLTFFIMFAALNSTLHASPQKLNDAAQTIKQETGGRILSAKTVIKNGKTIHKIKVLLPSGKVQTFKVSAQ